MKNNRAPESPVDASRNPQFLFYFDTSHAADDARRHLERVVGWNVTSVSNFSPECLVNLCVTVLPAWRAVLDRRASWIGEIPWVAYGSGDSVVASLQLGALDIVIEPWTVDELVLRVSARVSSWMTDSPLECDGTVLTAGSSSMTLTPEEGRIASILVRNPFRTISRELLVEGFSDGALNVLVSRLRKKVRLLASESGGDFEIRTVYGSGYRFHYSRNVESRWKTR